MNNIIFGTLSLSPGRLRKIISAKVLWISSHRMNRLPVSGQTWVGRLKSGLPSRDSNRWKIEGLSLSRVTIGLVADADVDMGEDMDCFWDGNRAEEKERDRYVDMPVKIQHSEDDAIALSPHVCMSAPLSCAIHNTIGE